MATKVGTFTKPTGGSGSTAVVSGVGATPKFVMLWTSGVTTADSYVTTGSMKTSVGWFNATTAQCTAMYCFDNDATANSDTYRVARASALVGITAGGTVEWEATVDSIGSDGFTLAFTPNTAAAIIINYLCLTGQDLANVTIGTFTVPATAGSFTPVTGLSYQPNAALFMSTGMAGSSLPQASDMAAFTFGAATSSTAEATINVRSRDNLASTVTHRASFGTACISVLNLTSSAARVLCDFTSFNSGGITLNASVVSGENPGVLVMYALLGGGSWHTGGLVSIASASTIATTAPGFLPDGIIAFSTDVATDDAGGTNATWTLGATDGTATKCISAHDQSGITTPSSYLYQDSTAIITGQFAATTDLRELFTSFDTNGFTLTQTTTTSNRNFKYLAFNTGSVPSAGGLSIPVAMHHRRMQGVS